MGNIIPKWLIDYQAFQQTPNANFRDIGLAAAANASIGAALFAYWTRKRSLQQSWFSVKLDGRPPDLPPPQAGVFAFLPALLRINEATFLKHAGFDALVYIRMYLLAAKIAAAVAVYAWCVILPINVLGGNAPDSAVPLNNFSLMSMSNIASSSPRLWAHVGGILLLTLSAYYLLNGEFTTYMRLRHAYLKLRAPHLRTVMLDNVPAELRGAAQLFVYFNHLYTDSVDAVACMQDLRSLRTLINRREAVLAQLERTMLKQQQQQQQQSSHSAADSSLSSERSRLERRLAELNTAISRQQSARLRTLRQNDERVLREVEAGGYMTSASFRPGYSSTCSRHTAGVASSATVAATAATTAGGSSGSTASSSSDSGSDDTACATAVVTEQQNGEASTECSCAAISIEEYLKPLGSARSTSISADTVLEFDDSGCCYIDSDSYYSSQQQQQCDSSARRAWQQLQHAGHVAVQWTNHAFAKLWNSDSDDVGVNQDDSRQPLLLPLIATDGSSSGGNGSSRDAAHCVRMAPRAFVTFKTFKEATVARQVHHGSKPGQLQSREAPEPRDLYWFNVHISRQTRAKRRILVDAFLCLLYVFWVIPVTALFLVFSQKALSARYSWIADSCANNSYFCTSLGTIQPVLLLVLMNLLPPLIRVLGMAEGCSAESWNQKLTLSRYFYFQIINVFLVTTVAGTMFDTLRLIVDTPAKVFTLLGESLPNVCGYFCIYIVIKFMSGLLIELTRMISLLQHYILAAVWSSGTARDKRAVVMGLRHYADAGWFAYPKYISQDLLVVVITFTFCCINPFILVISIPYLLCAHATYKHQLLYVYTPIFETGGTFFPKIFRRFIFGIIVAQATMGGVLLLKKAYYQAGCVIALMLCTWLFKNQQRQYFEPISHSLPLELATVLDMETEQLQLEQLHTEQLQSEEVQSVEQQVGSPYLQPELTALPVAKPEVQLVEVT